MGIYKRTIEEIEEAIANFKDKKYDIVNLQSLLLRSSREITAFEERELQDQLIKAEADIESVIYTIGPDEYDEFCNIIKDVQTVIDKFYP